MVNDFKSVSYPIKIEKTWNQNYKLVVWMLGNTCNYNCSFCGDEIKNGSQKWLDLDVYKKVCKNLIDQANKENKKVVFMFTGGEPTLYSHFLSLCKYVHENDGIVNVITNASRTLRWWQEIADSNVISSLFISAHTEQIDDVDHIISVTELFIDKPTYVLVQCTALPQYFDKALSFYNKIISNACCSVSMKLINSDNKFQYTDEQIKTIANNIVKLSARYKEKKIGEFQYAGKMKVTMSDGTSFIEMGNKLIALKINNFFGYKCSIGIDYINIVYDTVFRGQCKQDGPIGSVYDTIEWQKEMTTCFIKSCNCVTDYHETKYKHV